MAFAQSAMEMGFPYLDHQRFGLIIFPCLSVKTGSSMQYKVPLPSPSQIAISPIMIIDTYSKDQFMQVTLAFNHFGKELIQRMPRCRWGYFHVVNNDYTHWKLYAIGGSTHPTIISQGNRFIAPDDPLTKEITNRNYASESEWRHWVWRSEGDRFMNGAFF
ncbi:hypothetical protein Gotur_016005, partial [Gossypium turneri]